MKLTTARVKVKFVPYPVTHSMCVYSMYNLLSYVSLPYVLVHTVTIVPPKSLDRESLIELSMYSTYVHVYVCTYVWMYNFVHLNWACVKW